MLRSGDASMLVEYVALMTIVRAITEHDLSSSVFQAVLPLSAEGQQWFLTQMPLGVYLGVEDGGVLVGLGIVAPNASLNVYIEPSAQRRGFGKQVAKEALREATRRGIAPICARARIASGGDVLAQKLGFRLLRSEQGENFYELP